MAVSELTIRTEDTRLRQLEEIRRLLAAGKKLYLWGNGAYASTILAYLRENGITAQPSYLVDDVYFRPEEVGTVPLTVFLRNGDRDSVVIFAFYDIRVIRRKRAEWGSAIPHLFEFHFAVVQGKRLTWDASVAAARLEDYRRTYRLLTDETSRRTMQLFLNAATAGEFDPLFDYCFLEPAYFNAFTGGLPVDTLVDCGAYDGDSIHDFIAAHPGYKRIIAVEPDEANVEKLRQREARENIRDLTVVNKGVWSAAGTLRFQADGASNSHLVEEGGLALEVTTLDSLKADLSGRMMIKMDIEGSELEALRGGEALLREARPILAICVYHREEDLIEIPQFIHTVVGEGSYDYRLGFHGHDLAELCFYAIPKEDALRA